MSLLDTVRLVPALLIALAALAAQETVPTPIAAPAVAGGAGEVRWMVAPYLVAANITGEVGMGKVSGVPVSIDTGDILEHITGGGMLHAEVWWRDWGLIGDAVYMRLEDDLSATGPWGKVTANAHLTLTENVYEAAVAWRIASGRCTTDLKLGARLWDIEAQADITSPLPAANSRLTTGEAWVDPLIGVRAAYALDERWSLIAAADLGGFGLASDLAWNTHAYLGWAPAHWCTLTLGFIALGVDYSNDAQGSGYFAYDTITYGGVTGAVFTW